ncbi:MAG: hypothetical protein CMF29_04875 [Kiritimatiellaceae bacterium]|nr:hypothetical protein [Kiritimatiellaceae bacterium]
MIQLFKYAVAIIIVCIVGVFWFAFKASGNEKLDGRVMPIICLERSFFKATIGRDKKILLLGTMPGSDHLIEVWRGKNMTWTILFRNPKNDEICILASGNQLIPVDWFEEKILPQ